MPMEIKSCPFCGSAEAPHLFAEMVCCGACGCEGPPAHDEIEAVKLWNNRAEKTISVEVPGGFGFGEYIQETP